MLIENVPLATLSVDPANLRLHRRRNLDAIVASLRRFGQQKPIVVDAANIIRAGNGTFEAAKELGWETINIIRSPLAGAEMTAYAIADNRTAELAEWDEEALKLALKDAETGDVGFDADEIAALGETVVDEDDDASDLADEKYLILVTCRDEEHQADLLKRFAEEGLNCRAMMS